MQFAAIRALAVHDLAGRGKSYNYGYVWLILEPIIYIGVIRLAKSAFSALTPPSGMTVLTFYTLGVLSTFLSFDVTSNVFKAAGSSSGMLSFPSVTSIDLAIAQSFASFCIYFTLFWVFLVPISIYEGSWPPHNVLELMLAFVGLYALGVGLGLVLSGLYRVFPMMTKFWSMATRMLRMVSGMFFVITMMPLALWPYFTWNPILHLAEMLREGWFGSYVSPIASPKYVLEWILCLLLLGFSIERFMRRIPYA
jgi:capsular polysaccharide transport system permease protein